MQDGTEVRLIEPAAADLGMFSMFGRTEAPTKKGPTRGGANFMHAGNNGRHRSERVK